MKKHPLSIQIPKPCHEKWENMTPESGGNFCATCSKHVVDFTTLSDRQIQAYLDQSGGVGCGRFTANQLNRELMLPGSENRSSNLHRLFAGLLFVSASNLAQSAVVSNEIEIQTQAENFKKSHQPNPTDSIKAQCIEGKIIDSLTKEPIFGVRIKLKTGNAGCISDLNGYFRMNIPDSLFQDQLTILLKAPDQYDALEIQVATTTGLLIELDTAVKGIEMIGLIVYRPKWWQIGKKTKYFCRRVINKIKY